MNRTALCMYLDDRHRPWVVLNGKDGLFVQFELREDYSLAEARRWRTETQPEGCVADDDNGLLYIGEEGYGVWRLGADPGTPAQLASFAAIEDGELTADVEGLALYRTEGMHYLVVSSQGDNSYALYDTASGTHIGSFRIGDHPQIDDTSDTDGIAVTSTPLPGFPEGLLVVQDGDNPGGNQNFKLGVVDRSPTHTGNCGSKAVAEPVFKLIHLGDGFAVCGLRGLASIACWLAGWVVKEVNNGATNGASGRFPFTSFPRGWFFFEHSRNLPVGRLVSRQWLGQPAIALAGRGRQRLHRECVLSAPGRQVGSGVGWYGQERQPGVSFPRLLRTTPPGSASRHPSWNRTRAAGCVFPHPRRSMVSCSGISTNGEPNPSGGYRSWTRRAGTETLTHVYSVKTIRRRPART